ncbi:hypothetical protein KFL_012200010 [Klebsormidium nitens]|uniref:Uncharacterized protein n=1 Tax=Klebsormidium nitens TaxID=105231 RepID=A0A1Y1IUD2_KLENI|nr:hypothetical protein KFL_012200010 [Klebsormidium nitens]|eukprot:GAQ92951.1 hypothetical protein KFL_012200010 [Klebsormidium nitens]
MCAKGCGLSTRTATQHVTADRSQFTSYKELVRDEKIVGICGKGQNGPIVETMREVVEEATKMGKCKKSPQTAVEEQARRFGTNNGEA